MKTRSNMAKIFDNPTYYQKFFGNQVISMKIASNMSNNLYRSNMAKILDNLLFSEIRSPL